MASFTSVGDTTSLNIPAKGERITVSLSGTYNMTIELQRETGSPGSGAWERIERWTTANATVEYDYYSQFDNENIRLIVLVDTSGTCVATLTDAEDRELHVWTDKQGNPLMRLTQEGLEVSGSIRRFSSQTGGSAVVNLTAATLTLTAEDHAGRIVTVNKADGSTITLPAATGSGNTYTIFVGTTISSVGLVIQAASAADSFSGGVGISSDIAGVTMLAAATTDTITMSGSTTGGVVGSWVRFTDVASGKFMLEGFLCSTDAEANPFSAAV